MAEITKFIEFLSPYYGLDYIGNLLVIIGTILLGRGNRVGFIVLILSNILFLVFGILANSSGFIVFMVVMGFVNLYGFFANKIRG